jgi:hypothetical protein
MTDTAKQIASHLHCGATYDATKATRIAHALNTEERGEESNYKDDVFIGFEYRVEINGVFGRIAAFSDDEFVGYF